MKSYNYKMQWLFNVKGNFVATEKELKKELFDVLKALNPRSLTVIYFRDADFKMIGRYTGMVGFPSGTAFIETKKAIFRELKENPNITSVELIRK